MSLSQSSADGVCLPPQQNVTRLLASINAMAAYLRVLGEISFVYPGRTRKGSGESIVPIISEIFVCISVQYLFIFGHVQARCM